MSDYIFLLEKRLNRDQLQVLAQVQQAAAKAEVRLYLAGGAIRDLLGGFPIRDLDFCVEGPALKVVRQLDSRLFSVQSTDPDRRSAEVVYGGAVTAEIAMCRRERYPKPGGKPEIEPATIQDDLRRRDFTVNGIAVSLNPASRGLLLDPANGLADLERKELRALSIYSFQEDPVRLLRLARLAARLQYTIEEKTRSQFEAALASPLLDRIPPRVRLAELRRLAAEPDSAAAVKALADRELLAVFEPHLGKKLDLLLLAKLDKARRVAEESGVPVDGFGPFLFCLTRKLSASERAALRTRTGMKASEAALWTGLEARAKTLQKLLASRQTARFSGLYRTLSTQDLASALFLLAFAPAPGVKEKIATYFTQLYPLARTVNDAEVEAQTGVKRSSPKFASAREAHLAALLDKKPEKPPEPDPVAAIGSGERA
jgi:tRNA nucleotidyltransferase (CCA-adding enzyme)